jgi:NADPH-dependent curcumin reductase CurA
MSENKRFILVKRPEGMIRDTDFTVRTEPVPDIGDGEILIRNRYASIDPAMRGWFDDAPSYLPPIELDDAVRATTVATVEKSTVPGFSPGDWIMGLHKLETWSAVVPNDFTNKIDPDATASVTNYLSILGAVGLTAYFGVTEELKPQPGETFLVSGAAGAVGSLAGQLAKLAGARVVGIAGGPEKCRRLIDEYGFDAAIDYRGKDVETLAADIKAAAPDGVDVVFENVGGIGLDATLLNLNFRGRVGLCGLISEYNTDHYGARNLWQLIVTCGQIKGFLVSNYLDRFPEGGQAVATLVNEGKVRFHEDIDEGIDQAFGALQKLFTGKNQGKMILKIG